MLPRSILIFGIALSQCVVAAPVLTQRYAPLGSDSTFASDVISGDRPTFDYFGTNFSNNIDVYLIGGSALAADGHIYTRMLCDDLTYTVVGLPPYYTHYYVNDVNFESVNMNRTPTPEHAALVMAFFDSSGANGGPGKLLYREGYIGQFTEAGIYYFGITWIVYSPPLFMLPTSSPTIWGCVFFDSLANPDLDTTYMDNLGVMINSAPRAGSSQDLFYISDAAQGSPCPDGFQPGSQISHGENPPYTANFLLDQQLWDFDTLFTDRFDVGLCDIPYFGP